MNYEKLREGENFCPKCFDIGKDGKELFMKYDLILRNSDRDNFVKPFILNKLGLSGILTSTCLTFSITVYQLDEINDYLKSYGFSTFTEGQYPLVFNPKNQGV